MNKIHPAELFPVGKIPTKKSSFRRESAALLFVKLILIDKKLLFVIPANHPGYEVKNEVVDVIIAEIRPEGKRKTITEGLMGYCPRFDGARGRNGGKPAVGGRTSYIPVLTAAYEAIIAGSCS